MGPGAFKLVKVFQMLDTVPKIDADIGKDIGKIKGEINFDNVTFAYPSRPDIDILKDFKLKIKGGEFIAFCGESGCGKSTANKLILRSYDCLNGCLRIDG